ncbi:MAG: methyltransferase, partial [Lachnospiraceae bacterium]|nr:methyltransferase [Lachnospiraceae bacterium]
MSRHNEIKSAYQALGKGATFYDGMITCSTLLGKAVCRLVWAMGQTETGEYLSRALSGIPENFSGS